MKPSKADRRRIRLRRRAIRRLSHLKTKHKFVDHPRYGDQPVRSNECFTMYEVTTSFWQYSSAVYEHRIIFPQTAIRANMAKQNYGYGPRSIYVDITRPCRTCGRWFIFYALEQKFWFETLGFFVDADCVHCQDCRHKTHEARGRVDRYGELLATSEKSDDEWQELTELGEVLYAAGYIKKAETLLKTRKPKRLGR